MPAEREVNCHPVTASTFDFGRQYGDYALVV
jgi:hypothetical protein